MDFEVAVAGGGLVGAALARALRGLRVGLRVGLFVPRRPQAPAAEGALDSRIYAISPGNAGFLAALGAWQGIPAARIAPVHAMRVHGDDGAALLEFDAYRAGVGELAWIVEDCLLQQALWRGLPDREGLTLLEGRTVERVEIASDAATLFLDQGGSARAKLVVGADGAQSAVRAGAGIAAVRRSYAQTAVAANFACARPHGNIAWQWFCGGPVLALLPLPGERVSMVWSTTDAEAARLAALDAPSLCREVEAAARGALGELALVTPPRRFPLRRMVAARLVGERVALAGDAAHVIHPLAGQGANLGLQDARSLAAVLGAREPQRDPGDLRLLRRYERERAGAILAMRATVDGLFGLFGASSRPAARVRNLGLNLVDRLAVLKNVLVRQAMR